MGASLSTSNATVINDAVNTTVQTASNSCNADCSQAISGVDIILNNSTTGNVVFTQKCVADANCTMTNALEQTVTAYQLAQAKADAQSPILPIGIQINVSNATTTNTIRDELKQALNNQCKGNIDQNINDILVYANNSTTGDIAFIQEGSAFARCIMDNSGRMVLSMRQDGSATATSGSTFGGLIGLIILVVIIIVIIGAVRKANADKNSPEAQAASKAAAEKNAANQATSAPQLGQQRAINGRRLASVAGK